MSFKPIKEFLAYIEECHIALADLYLRLSLETTDKKVKLLLDFMRNKEQLSFFHLHEYAEQAPMSLLETWLDNVFDHSFTMKCQQMKMHPDLAIDDVVKLAMKLDVQLIELVQTAAYNTPTIEAEIALEILSNQEEEALHQVVIASHEFEFM
jgi:energy-converting hydrogenase A subunit M